MIWFPHLQLDIISDITAFKYGPIITKFAFFVGLFVFIITQPIITIILIPVLSIREFVYWTKRHKIMPNIYNKYLFPYIKRIITLLIKNSLIKYPSLK